MTANNFFKTTSLLFLWPLALTSTVTANEHSAHVHGVATLTLAKIDHDIQVHFASPAANLLGFEHQARSAEQKAKVKQLQALLSQPAKLLQFSQAKCTATHIDINFGNILGDEHHPKEHQASHPDKHQHDAHHDKKDHNEKDHHEHDAKSEHLEIELSYQFHCSNAEKISSVQLNIFKHFPAIEHINAAWLTDSAQGARKLTKTNARLLLK